MRNDTSFHDLDYTYEEILSSNRLEKFDENKNWLCTTNQLYVVQQPFLLSPMLQTGNSQSHNRIFASCELFHEHYNLLTVSLKKFLNIFF